ncbi:hypothetical protein ACN47E_007696 [Coniothyrium glycines]
MGPCGISGNGCLSLLPFRRQKQREKRVEISEAFTHGKGADASLHQTDKPSTQTLASGEGPAPRQRIVEPYTLPKAAPHEPSQKSSGPELTSIAPSSDNVTTALDRSLWEEAQDQVNKQTLEWMQKLPDMRDTHNPIAEMVGIVRCREDEHKSSAVKLTIGDREILWRDYAERVVTLATSIGDIAIAFAPAPGSAVWSAVKVLLNTNVAERRDLVAIMGCTELVLRLVRRGAVYEKVYVGGPPRSADQEELKQKLVDVYKMCLEFLAFVDGEMKRKNFSRFLDALVEPGQGEQRVSEIRNLEQELYLATQACAVKAREEHQILLRSMDAPLRRVDDNVTTVLKQLQSTERDMCMDYISTVPVGVYHKERCERRTRDTCEWLTGHPSFLKWEDLAYSSAFWLQGNMGTGKSFLSSKVIDRYLADEEDPLSQKHDEGFAYFYCSSSDQTRQTMESILRSYIRQLSEVPSHPERVHETAYDLYKTKGQIQHAISVKEWESTLEKMINSYPRTTLVLDALDECDEGTRRQFLELLERLFQNCSHPLKVFIASRPETDIRTYFKSFKNPGTLVAISTSDNSGDIEKFITDQINKNSVLWKDITLQTKELVKSTLIGQSGGMFRWTYLQWEQLKSLKLGLEIRKRLERLPKGLTEAYDEIMNRYDPDSTKLILIQRAARWVICARQALDSTVLLAAIGLESDRVDENPFDKSELTAQTLEDVCRHMIVKDSKLGVWSFPHASVREYFMAKDETWIRNARGDLTAFMIKCLSNCCSAGIFWDSTNEKFDRPDRSQLSRFAPCEWPPEHAAEDNSVYRWLEANEATPDDAMDPRHPFQCYVQGNWYRHARELSSQEVIRSGVGVASKQFFGEKDPQQSSRQYQVFFTAIVGHRSIYIPVKMCTALKDNITFVIVALGLHKALTGWWDRSLDVSPLVNEYGIDLLAMAINFGHTDLFKDLLSQGYDVNRRSYEDCHWTLQKAIKVGNIELVRLLLDSGADPDRIVGGHSYLCIAADFAQTECLQLLLKANADPNGKCYDDTCDDGRWLCEYGCALAAAAANGNLEIVKALIEQKAIIDPESSRVEAGANVNANPMSGNGSTLAHAVTGADPEGPRFPVAHGADPNAQLKYGEFGSPLAAAVYAGSLDCAHFLIVECHVKVNTYLEFGAYGSAISAAVSTDDHNDLTMIKSLVEDHGADLSGLVIVRPRNLEAKACYCLDSQKDRYYREQDDIKRKRAWGEEVDSLPEFIAQILLSMGFDQETMPHS